MPRTSRRSVLLAAAGTAVSLAVATTASADPFFQVVVSRFDLNTGTASLVPGLPPSQAGQGVVWNNPPFSSPGLSNAAVIDSAGNIAFLGAMNTLTGPPPTLSPIISTANQWAVFRATAASNYAFNSISIIARDGDPAGVATPLGGPTPTNPNNWRLNSTSNGAGLANTGVGMSPNGNVLISGLMNGTGATTNSNNAAFFTGPSNAISQVAVRGQGADGTTGASFATNLNFAPTAIPVNNSGQVAFASALSGGDTSTSGTTQNDSGLWLGSSSGITKIFRRGEAAPGTGGAVFGASSTNNSGSRGLNSSGEVMFTNILPTTQGNLPAAAVTGTLYSNAGGTMQLIAQSGSSVGGALPGVSYVDGNGSSINHVSITPQSFNNSGRALFGAKFKQAGSITSANDTAIMTWQGGTSQVLFQAGTTAVPGSITGATTFNNLFFDTGGNGQTRINNLNHYTFTAAMTPDGTNITTSNNQGVWLGNTATPGAAQLLARGGMVAPGCGGATFGNGFFGVVLNNSDMVLFQNTLSDGRAGLFVWGAEWGLVNLVVKGQTNILGPNYPVETFGLMSGSNGDGGVNGFNDAGQLTLFVTSNGIGGAFGKNGAHLVMQVPAPGAAAGIALLGLGTLGRRHRR